LDRRLAAKGEIVHLQLKALENDNIGLGRYGREEMARLLASFFDADMANRQRELANLEARVQKLHAQVDRREAARDAIIQLQVNVLAHEAAGLGFSTVPHADDSRTDR
jgi:phage gp37-like protein